MNTEENRRCQKWSFLLQIYFLLQSLIVWSLVFFPNDFCPGRCLGQPSLGNGCVSGVQRSPFASSSVFLHIHKFGTILPGRQGCDKRKGRVCCGTNLQAAFPPSPGTGQGKNGWSIILTAVNTTCELRWALPLGLALKKIPPFNADFLFFIPEGICPVILVSKFLTKEMFLWTWEGALERGAVFHSMSW